MQRPACDRVTAPKRLTRSDVLPGTYEVARQRCRCRIGAGWRSNLNMPPVAPSWPTKRSHNRHRSANSMPGFVRRWDSNLMIDMDVSRSLASGDPRRLSSCGPYFRHNSSANMPNRTRFVSFLPFGPWTERVPCESVAAALVKDGVGAGRDRWGSFLRLEE